MRLKHHPVTLAVTLALLFPPVFAQDQSPGDTDTRLLDTLIVTGTRVSDRTVAESQSPIDIITPETLHATGAVELATALARALPALNFPRPAVADGTSGVRPAQVRGLAPDQVLVLVNGKRRHLSAQVNVNETIGRGSSAVDFNAIPVAAIERVEVLRDGASAQYGSDAIAGVINVVLKGSGRGGSLVADAGIHSAGDGEQYRLSGDTGLHFAGERGTLHLAAQVGTQNKTSRSAPYFGNAPHTGNNPGVGEKTYLWGDPEVDDRQAAVNASFQLSDQLDAYANAIVGNRDILSFAVYRSRGHDPIVPQFYPNGYVPQIRQFSQDRALTTGLKGHADNGLAWDISYNHGYNHLVFHTLNSLNYTLGANSPTRFYDGILEYTHNILNADLSMPLNLGFGYPATLSLGAEYRAEKWNQSPGTPESYQAQGFGGFTAENAVHANRHSHALYAGLEADINERFSAGIATRYEDYSDFGSEVSGKLSARHAFTDTVALRATITSGFRAPALAQQYYQVVSPEFVNGQFFQSGTFPATGAVAQALGAEALKPETSLSCSLGLILQPTQNLYLTVDAYQIDIDERIVLSSNLDISNNPAAQAILSGLGVSGVTNARYFNNAIDTRTRGVDLVGTWRKPLDDGHWELTGSFNYNKTEITRIAENPAALQALGINLLRIGRDERGRIEEGFPHQKLVMGSSWLLGKWSFGLNLTRYGSFTTRVIEGVDPIHDQTYSAEWVADAWLGFKPAQGWTLTLGVDNLFDQYPDKRSELTNYNGQVLYSGQSPFGFNGAYVYGRVNYAW